jgi:hypothetical protein
MKRIRSFCSLAIPTFLFLYAGLFATGSARGAIGIDANVSKNQGAASTTVGTASFSTTAGNELLLAFVATDGVSSPNTIVTNVSGAGLTWVRVQRTNVQLGTSEIWRAFSASALTNVTVTATLSQQVDSFITVMSFTGVNTSGTNGSGAIGAVGSGNGNPGAPTAALFTLGNGSLVLGVGNDWDNAITRTPGTGQTVVRQYLAPVGDTYWVQMQTSPTPSSGMSVTINDTAPTGDRYNLSIVEVLAAAGGGTTGSISGTISPPASGNGATVTLSQNGTTVAMTTVGTSGSYSFSSVANGTYTVTPSETGFTFSPPSQSVIVNGNAATVPVFTATPVTWTISGTITPAVSGATVTLTQGATTIGTAPVSGSGTYSFLNVPNGTYTVTPSATGFTFSPPNQTVPVSGGNVTVPNFTATAVPTWTISGTITPAESGKGALVTLSGTASQTATADNSGTYTFIGLVDGTYAVTPSKAGFAFSPTSQSVPINGGNATVPSFTATMVSTWTISGTITGGSSTTVTLAQSGTTIGTAVADVSGRYSFANIANGTYTITPSKTGFTFSPTIQSVPINGANAINIDFTATDVSMFKYPDLSDILPTAAIAVAQTPTGKQFQYTHDTYNGGPGPLVIQPAYNPATGNYQGTQYIYSQSSSGTWSLTKQIPVAGTFVFHAIHGHFHFPFASYGIYNVGPGGGPGTLVVPSAKIGFCMHDSFIYNPTLPNAGALGNLGSCSDPSSIQGLNIGAVDEYDKTDDGQSIPIDGVPDGTYWLRAIVDPNNFFAEADKTNNETDVKFTLSGTNVQILQTVVPVLVQPPAISMASPSAGSTVTGIVQLTASTATTSGVQYLLDGQHFGSVVTSAPYTLSWDSSTAANGTHWLAAQTTDPTGVIGTSPVLAVTVSNNGPSIPAVQVTSPANGSIVSAIITLYATVSSDQTIANVKFFVDNLLVASPVTSTPYSTPWDTTTATVGTHVITATATDIAGNVGTSAQVTVTVDNTHPAKLIGKDVQISVDGSGTLTTAPFSTTTPGDLFVAFVAYDGPLTSPQTATVSGAGLTWTLLVRSNTQAGTSEIWSARATGTLSSVTVSSQVGAGSGFHGSLTVIAFTNAAGTSVVGRTGAPTGAPDIYLPGVVAGDWVFAAGNDWDNAIARTPVAGQVLVHQSVDTRVGDTYWVQSTAAPSTANALVDIHDSAPTTDRWNYAAVEVVATR